MIILLIIDMNDVENRNSQEKARFDYSPSRHGIPHITPTHLVSPVHIMNLFRGGLTASLLLKLPELGSLR
jgi:hypothetical protein